jgi:N-acetylglucosaminyldiphosphoundecaprenol N-acetyl-beta-D-mannosaminyltransferase
MADSSPVRIQHATDEYVNVLGVRINAVNIENALTQINQWVSRSERHFVCICTVHTIMECRRNEGFRKLVNGSGLNTPDGMPLVWLAHLAGKQHVERVYGPDLMLAHMERSVHTRERHFLYGGVPGIAERLEQNLRRRFPGINIVGRISPPFAAVSQLTRPETADQINRATPDIVWVGLSTPKQEFWMARMRHTLKAPVLIGVGAAFDFHAGAVPQAPQLLQRNGLEWAFRLAHEPRRLWRRYLFDNPRFLVEIAAQLTHLRRYDLS